MSNASLDSQRKEEHLAFYKESRPLYNDFDKLRIQYHSLPHFSMEDVDLSTQLCGYTLSCPFFINAISGGSPKAHMLNQTLARIAAACDLLLCSGSYSIALKDERYKEDFLQMRRIHAQGLFACNLGVDKAPSLALQALEETKADILQIHLNLLQEMLMPEGDKNFSQWKKHLQEILSLSPQPVLVKEVGFGFSKECLRELVEMGVRHLDVSGKGGTNFAFIENKRNLSAKEDFASFGFSTVESLLFAKAFKNQLEIVASGGIRKPLDIFKALALGAKAVGLSGKILELLETYSEAEVIELLQAWKQELKMLFCLVNAQNIKELHEKNCVFFDNTKD